MAHFYGTLTGARQYRSVTRRGFDGIVAHVHGWDLGIRAEMSRTPHGDVAHVWITAGTNASRPAMFLGSWVRGTSSAGQRVSLGDTDNERTDDRQLELFPGSSGRAA